MSVQFQPGLVSRLVELPENPVSGLVGELQGSSDAECLKLCKTPWPDAPDVGQFEH